MKTNVVLPEWMLDETPLKVELTGVSREPVEDPRLGIDVGVPAEGTPHHLPVPIGDSLIHSLISNVYLIGWIDRTLDGIMDRILL